jgi:CHAD domain-containing protein
LRLGLKDLSSIFKVSNDSIDNAEDVAGLSFSADAPATVRSEELVRERVRRFMKLLPEVLNSERVEAVHDLRVWSRRLQQVLVTMFPTEQENRTASLVRALRRARRGLSGWRDCDVLIGLLDKRLRRLRDPDEQRAWRVVRDYLAKSREKEIARARHRLVNRRLFTLAQRTEQLLKHRGLDTPANAGVADAGFIARVSEFIKTAHADWEAALAVAAESAGQTDAHSFRIKTKRLRYRIELARDLGDKEILSPLNWLKRLQDSLGQWHDRAELARFATRAIANSEFLLNGPRPASLLLKRLARELLSDATKLKSLLAELKDANELSQLKAWIDRHGGEPDSLAANRSSTES